MSVVSCVAPERHSRFYRLPATAELPPGPWVCAMCRPLVLDPATVEWSDSPSPSPAASSSARSLPRPAVKARRFDPETSGRAARQAVPRQGTQRHRLLAAIAEAENGLTAEAAAQECALIYVSASTRCTELEQQGFVERRGRRATSTGTSADVLHATGEGRAALDGSAVAA